MRSGARVRFDNGVISVDQSQFFATHSNQGDCFILGRLQIASNGFFRVCHGGRGQRPAFTLCRKILKLKKLYL